MKHPPFRAILFATCCAAICFCAVPREACAADSPPAPPSALSKGDALFVLNQVYETRDPDQARFESHRRYIDIQYVFEGHETLRLAFIDDATPVTEFDAEKDFRLYAAAGDYSSISLKKGMLSTADQLILASGISKPTEPGLRLTGNRFF